MRYFMCPPAMMKNNLYCSSIYCSSDWSQMVCTADGELRVILRLLEGG